MSERAMRGRDALSLLILLSGTCRGIGVAGAAPLPASRVIVTDLDGDRQVERVVLQADRDPSVSVWRGNRCLWRGVPRRWKPWKLATADVDGDGRREIVVGVHKATRYFPRPHNCLFIYGFDGRTVRPKWLGSSLSRPFEDFAFANLDGDRAEKLVSVEITRRGTRCLVVYSWNGFGFTAEWQRGEWKTARLLETGPGRIVLQSDSRRVPVSRRMP
jgi:hypothetical protein